MPFQMVPMEKSDEPALVNVMWEAFRTDMMGVFFPNGFSDEDRVWFLEQERKSSSEKAERYWWKVVDTDLPDEAPNGKMIGISSWYVNQEDWLEANADAEGEDDMSGPFPPGANVECLKYFKGCIKETRKQNLGGRAHIILGILATDPQHHRRGVGAMQLKWGQDLSDKLGMPLYLESSPIGKPLYERWGYEPIAKVPFDARDWGGKHELQHYCMLRPARPAGGEA